MLNGVEQNHNTQLEGYAEIVKIEHPTRGDDTRAWGPPYAPYTPESGRQGPGESAYFLSVNRNKKSLALSFSTLKGQAILHALAKECDVLVENFLPNTLAKYSLSYSHLSEINPSLIYTSITGYGQTGPYSSRAGYDVMVEAEMGLMHITGARDGPPVKVGVAVTDLTTGLYAANSILAAIIQRSVSAARSDGRKGRGQHIDVALSDCQVATLTNIAESSLVSKEKDSGRWGTAHPSIVPYQAFKTADGDILVGGGNDKLFRILCTQLGKPEWGEDDRFATNSSRVTNREILEPLIEAETKKRSTREWLEVLEGSGMPYAAVNDIRSTLDHPHVRARNMVTRIQHPACGPIDLVDVPVKYSGSQPRVRDPPPLLGQHTHEILTKILGTSRSELAKLEKEGVIA